MKATEKVRLKREVLDPQGDAVKRMLIVCALMLALTLLPMVVKRLMRRAPIAE